GRAARGGGRGRGGPGRGRPPWPERRFGHERHRLYAGPAPGLGASTRLLTCRRRQGHQERAHRGTNRPRARPVAHPAGHGRRRAVARGALQPRDRGEGGGGGAATPGGIARLRDGHRGVQRRGCGDRRGVGRDARQALPGHDPGPGFGPDRSAGQGRDRGRSDSALSLGTPSRTAEDDRHVSRLMLFFAIVYLVEGIGQARVGIIYQPLTHYLKDIGWTPVEGAAYFAVLNFPWIIKPVFGLVSDFVPLFGYRRKSYLIIGSFCAPGAYGWRARLTEPGEFALLLLLTSYAMATASTLCGALLAENGQSFRLSGAFVGQQWLWFYIAIM